jgi:hypothetical protein
MPPIKQATGRTTVSERTTLHFCGCQSRATCISGTIYLFIVKALDPGHKTEERQDLRLDLEGDVEPPGDVVYTQRNTSPRPQHHHGRLKARGIVTAVVDDDLRYELFGWISGRFW